MNADRVLFSAKSDGELQPATIRQVGESLQHFNTHTSAVMRNFCQRIFRLEGKNKSYEKNPTALFGLLEATFYSYVFVLLMQGV